MNSWAARTQQPIRVLYPALRGTRDEKLVEIVRYRLLQFDLLLGGVRADVDPDAAVPSSTTAAEVLEKARAELKCFRLGLSERGSTSKTAAKPQRSGDVSVRRN